MKFNILGTSGLQVSEIGLGAMTFGKQTGEAEAHAQLSLAVDNGVNLVDTSELYPAPAPDPDTQGLSESYIGSWLARTGRRGDVIIASKVVGRAPYTEHIRGGNNRLDRANIRVAVEGSLRRLRTDYIDIYQVHWPDRTTNALMKFGYVHNDNEDAVDISETLSALDELRGEGKIRAIGVSNESAWGVWQYLRLAKARGLPRIASIQNAYSLLNRSYEIALAEFSHREGIGLIAYQLIGMAMLTGKYAGGVRPEGARLTIHPHPRYTSEASVRASAAYVDLARRYGIEPGAMAMAFVRRQPFVSSSLIGATTAAQLEQNLAWFRTDIPDDIVSEIDAIHKSISNPAP